MSVPAERERGTSRQIAVSDEAIHTEIYPHWIASLGNVPPGCCPLAMTPAQARNLSVPKAGTGQYLSEAAPSLRGGGNIVAVSDEAIQTGKALHWIASLRSQ
ncbi:MAG: hypothetical protein LBT00_14810 [Spirochaetaceae bacterium]|nr:hypothetical protein [Spirochaetaceae bacterium]